MSEQKTVNKKQSEQNIVKKKKLFTFGGFWLGEK